MNPIRATRVLLLLCWLGTWSMANAQDAATLAGWLDVPPQWSRGVLNNLVVASPHDLPPGATLQLLVEPLSASDKSLKKEYKQATADLGLWLPIGDPVNQNFDTGWNFRHGIGMVILDTGQFVANIAVAKKGNQKIRFWALSDSEETFVRYKDQIGAAFSSAQDSLNPRPVAQPSVPSASPAQSAASAAGQIPRVTPTLAQASLPSGFGEGVSGVYVGIERGLRASAGVGAGQQQVFNQSTGQFETSNTGTAPQVMTQVSDYAEVDVLFPDGTYRRRLPIRGLYTNLEWEKTQQTPLWGTWTREGDTITVTRKPGKYEGPIAYKAVYTLKNGELISKSGRPWTKLPMQRGVRLQGTYARHDVRRPDAPRIEFRADGTFREIDDFLDMVGSPWHMVEPDMDATLGRWTDHQIQRAMVGGKGTYSFDDFTLTFKTDDGRIWQINAYIPAGDSPPSPKRLVINGYQLLAD